MGWPSLAFQDYIPHGRQAGSVSSGGTLLKHSLDWWRTNGHPQMLLSAEMPALLHETDDALVFWVERSRLCTLTLLETPVQGIRLLLLHPEDPGHSEPSHSSTVCHSTAALTQLGCRSTPCWPQALCFEQSQVSAPIQSCPDDAMKPLPKTPSEASLLAPQASQAGIRAAGKQAGKGDRYSLMQKVLDHMEHPRKGLQHRDGHLLMPG